MNSKSRSKLAQGGAGEGGTTLERDSPEGCDWRDEEIEVTSGSRWRPRRKQLMAIVEDAQVMMSTHDSFDAADRTWNLLVVDSVP